MSSEEDKYLVWKSVHSQAHRCSGDMIHLWTGSGYL